MENHVFRRQGNAVAIFAATLLAGSVLVSCASAPNREENAEPYSKLDAIPDGKAVVYMYHNLDIATVLTGQVAAFYPSSCDPKGKLTLQTADKYPGVVETYPGDAARFIVDPADNKMVILTRLGGSSGGGSKKTKVVQLENLAAGDTVYIDVCLNGSKKTIDAVVVPEADLLPLIEQGKIRKPVTGK